MPPNTKQIPRDLDNLPAPSGFDDAGDQYVVVRANASGHLMIAGVGEVQANPTQYTVLSRLKGIGDQLAAGIPLSGRSAQYLTLANAVSVMDTTERFYNLITHGGLTASQIRQFREFRVSAINSHDQPARVRVATAIPALGLTTVSTSAILYEAPESLAATNGRIVLLPGAMGVGGSAISVPALRGMHHNLLVGIKFETAPSSGSFTVEVSCHA